MVKKKNENFHECMKKKKVSAKRFLQLKKSILFAYLFVFICQVNMSLAYATHTTATPSPASGSAEGKWDTIVDSLIPWIKRFGGAIIIIGAIMIGSGIRQDDPEGKSKGIKTVIGGCIIYGIGLTAKSLMA